MAICVWRTWKERFAVSHFVMVTSELWQRMNRFTGERGDLLSNSWRRHAFDLRDVYRLLLINEPMRAEMDSSDWKSYSTGSRLSFSSHFHLLPAFYFASTRQSKISRQKMILRAEKFLPFVCKRVWWNSFYFSYVEYENLLFKTSHRCRFKCRRVKREHQLLFTCLISSLFWNNFTNMKR